MSPKNHPIDVPVRALTRFANRAQTVRKTPVRPSLTRRRLTAVALGALILSSGFVPLPAQAKKSSVVEKPIKRFIGAVRYGKNEMALKMVDDLSQAKLLLGDQWDKGTKEQQKEFRKLFSQLFSVIAFPKLKNNLQKVASILYGKPEFKGKTAILPSTLVVQHALKKQEIKLSYTLAKTKGGYKLVDVTFQGDKSLLTNIRDDQIGPLMKEGGWNHLITQLRARMSELPKP